MILDRLFGRVDEHGGGGGGGAGESVTAHGAAVGGAYTDAMVAAVFDKGSSVRTHMDALIHNALERDQEIAAKCVGSEGVLVINHAVPIAMITELTAAFPQFEIDFKIVRNVGSPSRSALVELVRQELLRLAGSRVSGLLDYGGSVVNSVRRVERNIHHCLPVGDFFVQAQMLDDMDFLAASLMDGEKKKGSFRSKVAIAEYLSLQAGFGGEDLCGSFESEFAKYRRRGDIAQHDHIGVGERFGDYVSRVLPTDRFSFCVDPLKCHHDCKKMIVNHLVLEISVFQVAEIMLQHGVVETHGCYLFDPNMYLSDRGRLERFGIDWEIKGSKATFVFSDDAAVRQAVDYDILMSLVSTNAFEVGGHAFMRETHFAQDTGLCYYTLRDVGVCDITLSSMHAVHVPALNHMVDVVSYVAKKGRNDLSSPDAFQRVEIRVNAEWFRRATHWAMRMEKLDYFAIFSYAAAADTRVMGEYTNVKHPNSMEPWVLEAAVRAIYCLCFMERYRMGRIVMERSWYDNLKTFVQSSPALMTPAFVCFASLAGLCHGIMSIQKAYFRVVSDLARALVGKPRFEFSAEKSNPFVEYLSVGTVMKTGSTLSFDWNEGRRVTTYREYHPSGHKRRFLRTLCSLIYCSVYDRDEKLRKLGVDVRTYGLVLKSIFSEKAVAYRTDVPEDCDFCQFTGDWEETVVLPRENFSMAVVVEGHNVREALVRQPEVGKDFIITDSVNVLKTLGAAGMMLSAGSPIPRNLSVVYDARTRVEVTQDYLKSLANAKRYVFVDGGLGNGKDKRTYLSPEALAIRDKISLFFAATPDVRYDDVRMVHLDPVVNQAPFVAARVVENPLELIQHEYAEIFKASATEDSRYDKTHNELENTNISVCLKKLSISLSKIDIPKTTMMRASRLKLNPLQQRIDSVKDTLSIVCKRIADANLMSTVQDMTHQYGVAISNTILYFCRPGALDQIGEYMKHPVVPNVEDLSVWLSKLPAAKIKGLESVDPVKLDAFCATLGEQARLMVKDRPKMSGNDDARTTGIKGAAISHCSVGEVAATSQIFTALFDRTAAILNANVLINSRKNVKDIIKFVEQNRPDEGVDYTGLECDFSSFDKTQLERCFVLELLWYILMGGDVEFLQLWFAITAKTQLSSTAGIKLWIAFQRKSGYTNTTSGNTVVNMLTVAGALDLSKVTVFFSMFIGDDSLVVTSGPVKLYGLDSYFSNVWNLSAKTTSSKCLYFCSCYLILSPFGVFFMPDPLKAVQKFRMDVKLKNYDTRTGKHITDCVEEMAISYADNMNCYRNDIALDLLNAAVLERTKGLFKNPVCSYKPLLEALATLAVDKKKFAAMYEAVSKPVFY